MGVDVTHLVLETFGNSDDQIVDEGSDCAEGSDILAYAMMEFDHDLILALLCETDGEML